MLLSRIRETLDLIFMQVVIILSCQMSLATCEANVMGCVRNESCAQTFGEIYNSLASAKNYFKIAEALYPATTPSSVLVHVNLYVTKQENSSLIPYTWSKSCLYAGFPTNVLQILSLGSILVAPRTQQLDITIPPFCCNVSWDERKMIVKGALASLEDLAVSPAIQDPRLNTAECVVEGHKASISAIGRRSFHIRAILWLSLIFTIICGPLLALIALIFLHNSNSHSTALVTAGNYSLYFILIVEFVLVITALVFSAIGKASFDIYAILGITVLEVPVLGALVTNNLTGFDFLPDIKVRRLVFFTWGNLTVYHFCWLVIGIMLNPIWGLIVLLFIGVIFAAFFFAVYIYTYYYETTKIQLRTTWFKLRSSILCTVGLLSVWLLVAVVILSGQSFFGRETANDVVKAVTLYCMTAFISWITSWVKNKNEVKDKSKKGGREKEASKEEEEIPLLETR
ncbi:uncharacterized protein [Montipora foliosa]|uniref:uncharacterized protein n=1 Tax=Montipora foliosa TaxID=591990 RepID=UPI0035F1B6A7